MGCLIIIFTKLSKFHRENPQFLRHPIKFAILDSSTTPDCTTKLTIKATGSIFVGALSKHAFKLQNDKKIDTQRRISALSLSEHLHVNWKQQMIISRSACSSDHRPDNCLDSVHATVPKTFRKDSASYKVQRTTIQVAFPIIKAANAAIRTINRLFKNFWLLKAGFNCITYTCSSTSLDVFGVLYTHSPLHNHGPAKTCELFKLKPGFHTIATRSWSRATQIGLCKRHLYEYKMIACIVRLELFQ